MCFLFVSLSRWMSPWLLSSVYACRNTFCLDGWLSPHICLDVWMDITMLFVWMDGEDIKTFYVWMDGCMSQCFLFG